LVTTIVAVLGLFKECVREIWIEKHNVSVAELEVVTEHVDELISRQNAGS